MRSRTLARKEQPLAEAQVREMLAAKGLRATKRRMAVARIIAAAAQPVGVKEIHRRLSRTDSTVGLATVYRALAVLEDAGVARRQPRVGSDSAQYAPAPPAAAGGGQVVCSRCGKTESIGDLPEFASIRSTVARNSKFAAAEQSLYIIADCRNERCG
ncbi:MAG: transcriptional repressor [Betaproteobacteria bacterium AqS2]|uniref:Ferric uptake regulation protein n=1 Tax=Candidatus Amphirhobacter heronislandensis TaxID=1732024 RepID=A0A930XXR7_9GAMM|nr:transcriptional repressor [Betaproteobacteria bacterium AqS2]